MPYETGSTANTSTLLAAIGVFAQTCGWTQHFISSSYLIISRNGLFTTRFFADSFNNIDVAGINPYDSGLQPQSQTGVSWIIETNNLVGPYAATHFFGNASSSSDSYIHIVAQVSSGAYRHFGCGGLRTFGAVTTGQYVFGTRGSFSSGVYEYTAPFGMSDDDFNSTTVRADSDGISPRWLYNDDYLNGNLLFINDSRNDDVSFASSQTQRAVLNQVVAYIKRSSGKSMLGIFPNVRTVSLQYLAPNETVTLGSDQWKVFPITNRYGATGLENSDRYGLAYKI